MQMHTQAIIAAVRKTVNAASIWKKNNSEAIRCVYGVSSVRVNIFNGISYRKAHRT